MLKEQTKKVGGFIGIALALLMFVPVLSFGGAGDGKWGGLQRPQASAPIPTYAPAVPVITIIDDPLGDHITSPGNPIVDINLVQGGTDGTDVTLKVTFSPDTVMSDVVGFIDLDTDQDPATGAPPNANGYIPGTTQDIGVEFFLSLFSLPSGFVEVYDAITFAYMGTVPGTIVGQTVEFTVPLTMLGGDDGGMDVGMVLGNFTEPTDAAPNAGHGTIGSTPPADVTGCVILKGVPVVGRKVVLTQPLEPKQTTITDASGCYEFTTVVSGKKFTVKVVGPVVP